MKRFLHNMSGKLQQWIDGRYGMDELSRTLFLAGCVTLMMSSFKPIRIIYLLTLLTWTFSIFRCYSRKIYNREAERSKYLQLTGRIRAWFIYRRRKWAERKTYKYIRCKTCKKNISCSEREGQNKNHMPVLQERAD